MKLNIVVLTVHLHFLFETAKFTACVSAHWIFFGEWVGFWVISLSLSGFYLQ
jgi:hypothetical protein